MPRVQETRCPSVCPRDSSCSPEQAKQERRARSGSGTSFSKFVLLPAQTWRLSPRPQRARALPRPWCGRASYLRTARSRARISQETIAEVSAKLEEMDPQADIVLDLSCPDCGHLFKTPFFIEDFMLREIRTRMRQLEKEVHWIAFNYHWSEDDILSLPMSKRSRYVDLINRTLSGETI